MPRLTPLRLYSLALAVGLLGFLSLGLLARQPSSRWEGLLSGAEAELVFVLNPADCKLDGREIRDLNHWVKTSPVPVRAVFLSPPADDTTRHRLLEQFSLDMPVTWDEARTWVESLNELDFGGGVAILSRGNRPYAMVKLDAWRMLAENIPN